MKTIFMVCAAFLSSIQGYSASFQPANLNASTNISYQPFIDQNPKRASKKPLKERPLYYKGKGTVGLIAGLLLGPIGILGAHLFSHNQSVREKANTGFAIWLCAALVGALVWDIIDTKPTIGDILDGVLQVILQGLADNN